MTQSKIDASLNELQATHYRCVHCAAPTHQLYKTYKNTKIITLQACKICKKDVDPYIEYDPTIKLLDVMLLNQKVFIHLFYNTRNLQISSKLIRLFITSIIIKTVSEICVFELNQTGSPLNLNLYQNFWSPSVQKFYQNCQNFLVLENYVNLGQTCYTSKNFNLATFDIFSNLTNIEIFNDQGYLTSQAMSEVVNQNLQNLLYTNFLKNLLQAIFFIVTSSILLNFDVKTFPRIAITCYFTQMLKILVPIYVYFQVQWIYVVILDVFTIILVTRFYLSVCLIDETDEYEVRQVSWTKFRVKSIVLLAAGLSYFVDFCR